MILASIKKIYSCDSCIDKNLGIQFSWSLYC